MPAHDRRRWTRWLFELEPRNTRWRRGLVHVFAVASGKAGNVMTRAAVLATKTPQPPPSVQTSLTTALMPVAVPVEESAE